MKAIFRNFLSIGAGLLVGSVVNMALVKIGPYLIPPPEGVDMTTAEGLKEAIPLFKPAHFLMPFLAHALGTFTGAVIVTVLSTRPVKFYLPLMVGFFFLMGGIMSIMILPSPLWFTLVDLLFAYLPMAWLGYYLINRAVKSDK